MSWWQDPKVIIMLVGVFFSFITLLVVLIKAYTDGKVFKKILYNDLKHLSDDFKDMVDAQYATNKELIKQGKRIAKIEGLIEKK